MYDKFNHSSCVCIDGAVPKYASENVLNEFIFTHQIILIEIGDDIREVLYRLGRKPDENQMTFNDLGWMVSLGRGKRIERFLNAVAQSYNGTCVTFGQMYQALENSLNEYLSEAYIGLTLVNTMVSNGTISYWVRSGLKYTGQYHQIRLIVGDHNDTNNLIDAHDLATCCGMSDLDFVTTDNKEIKMNETTIKKTMQINSIILLSKSIP